MKETHVFVVYIFSLFFIYDESATDFSSLATFCICFSLTSFNCILCVLYKIDRRFSVVWYEGWIEMHRRRKNLGRWVFWGPLEVKFFHLKVFKFTSLLCISFWSAVPNIYVSFIKKRTKIWSISVIWDIWMAISNKRKENFSFYISLVYELSNSRFFSFPKVEETLTKNP